MATPAPRYSASSGCAPKMMMRSLPSLAGGVAAELCASATVERSCRSVAATNPNAATATRVTAESFMLHTLHLLSLLSRRQSSYTSDMRTALLLLLLAAPAAAQDRVDPAVVDRIKGEAFDRSKVMDHLYQITERHGPRLTWSAGYEDAANWATAEMKRMGLSNVHTEKWAPAGRNWTVQQSSAELTEPRYQELTAVPLAWSASTNGPVTGELVLAPYSASFREGPKKLREALDAYKAKWTGKLRGKIVLLTAPRVPEPQTRVQFRRYTAAELSDLETAPEPVAKLTAKKLEDLEWPESPEDAGKFFAGMSNALMEQFYDLYDEAVAERGRFLAKEGVVGVLTEDQRAHEGMVFAE